MPQQKQQKKPAKKTTRRQRKTASRRSVRQTVVAPIIAARLRIEELKSRRPHRSFKLTRRRDYARSLKLPGYILFSAEVLSTLAAHKKTYLGIIALYASLTIILGGLGSQETYKEIVDLFNQSVGEIPAWNFASLYQAGALALTAFSGNGAGLTEVQRVYLSLMAIATWLVIVWLLREQLAGRTPKIRDGIYNSMAPFFSTFLVALVGLLQLVPLGITALVYVGLSSVGLVDSGFGAMLYGLIFALVAALTLYWLSSTFVALVVVTLPGMYPLRAVELSGDLVVGRRLRITLRVVWGVLFAVTFWFVVMVPVILLENWLSTKWEWIAYVPFAPIFALIASTCALVWIASYVYLLYRKVVADGAAPA